MIRFSRRFECPKCGFENTPPMFKLVTKLEVSVGLIFTLAVTCNCCGYSTDMRCKDDQEKIDDSDLVVCDHTKFGPCKNVNCEYRNPHKKEEFIGCRSYHPIQYKGKDNEEV